MKKTAEQELVVKATKGTKITRANVKIAEDGSVAEIHIISKVVEEPVRKEKTKVSIDANTNNFDELFPIVEASKLSLEDEFLKHEPETKEQKRLKKSIVAWIKSGLSDFRRPIMDPSEDEEGNIVFVKGNKPAVGHSANWWNKTASEFMPAKNSREGTEKEYVAFLGVLIKELIEDGYKIAEAWKVVCDDSRDLGNYANSKDSKGVIEFTGSRQIGRWFDLGNTCKIIKQNEASGLLLAGGVYNDNSNDYPLADLFTILDPFGDYCNSVGWLVLDV